MGGATDQVIGCSLTLKLAVAKAASAQVSAEVIRSASQVRDLTRRNCAWQMAVDAIGVGRSYDHPGAAILLFVNSRESSEKLPRSINGVSTRVIEGESWASHGMLTSEESAQLLTNVADPLVVYTLRSGELERAKAVETKHQAEYLSQPESFGSGNHVQRGCAGRGRVANLRESRRIGGRHRQKSMDCGRACARRAGSSHARRQWHITRVPSADIEPKRGKVQSRENHIMTPGLRCAWREWMAGQQPFFCAGVGRNQIEYWSYHSTHILISRVYMSAVLCVF